MILLQADSISWTESIWNYINKVDQDLFLFINHVFANSFLDDACLAWREPKTWLPLYFFLLIFSIWKLKKESWKWILLLIITVSILDQVSSNFIKDYFGRIRPCGDPYFSQFVRLVYGRCPTSGSFTSSHAANHFGAATFIIFTLKPYLKASRHLFFLWAIIICFSQVYIGVHYPLDVIAGGILGVIIGYITSKIYERVTSKNMV